jgi:[ribosomal protein S5]-alanine N-acetyltransferase
MSFCTQQYVDWMNDPEVYMYLDTQGGYSIDKLQRYIADVEKKDILFWAITVNESGKHTGNIKIDPVNTIQGLGEYGIMMGERSEWGKGYAKEASQLVITYCFDVLQLRKITLGVIEDNTAAVKLYESLGFVTEGVYRYHGKYAGKYCHDLRMALFNSNFKY